mmetsp:Transcript_40156/g.113559  ORF Transcript_40156/g.113559 Transcript_40156/m.113559 type:complete len:267 (+) Transcript_40156:1445-2245(+)
MAPTFSLNALCWSSATVSFACASSTSCMDCFRTWLSSTLCRSASCSRTQYNSWQKNLASCAKRWRCNSLRIVSNCCVRSCTSERSFFSSASSCFRYLSCSSARAFSFSSNSLSACFCRSVISSRGIWSIHGSRSSVISRAERSFFVLSVPPIICCSARCPASFSRSRRRRSSSRASASAILCRSSSEIHFSALISLSFTWSTESASSQSCSSGSGTFSSICSSPRIERMRVTFSRIPSMMFLLSCWHTLKSSLKAARWSAARDCRR